MDCEWLRDLHSVGLLSPSFRPAAEIVELRADVHHRHNLVEAAATALQRAARPRKKLSKNEARPCIALPAAWTAANSTASDTS